MAGSGSLNMRRGCKPGCAPGAGAAAERIPALIEKGYGTPTHVSPEGTVYIKLDATMGTSSHYRMASGSWAAMSDD